MPFFVIECSCQYLNKNYVILEVASCVFHHIQIEKQVDYFVRAINLEEVSDLKDSIFISRQNAFPPKHTYILLRRVWYVWCSEPNSLAELTPLSQILSSCYHRSSARSNNDEATSQPLAAVAGGHARHRRPQFLDGTEVDAFHCRGKARLRGVRRRPAGGR